MREPLEKPECGNTGGVAAEVAISELRIPSLVRARLADYSELAKFRLSLLVLVVTAAGYGVGSGAASIDFAGMAHVILGTALVAFAANAFNQILERDFDRLMPRTANRPLPAGRLSVPEAMAFAVLTALAGTAHLWLFVNGLSASLAVLTLLIYVTVYTPLKRLTWLNTLFGAVPGALPPVIGYAGAAGTLDVVSLSLFAILFFWQMPHFFSIAWLYRDDYARGGYRMLSVVDASGQALGRQTVWHAMLLIPVSLWPWQLGVAGPAYAAAAVALGLSFFAVSVRFACGQSRATARALLLASIAYLPLVMAALLADHRPF